MGLLFHNILIGFKGLFSFVLNMDKWFYNSIIKLKCRFSKLVETG